MSEKRDRESDMVLVELDDRRRASLGRLGKKEHTRYLVEEREDGTLLFHPVKVVPLGELVSPAVVAMVEKSASSTTAPQLS
ncbi:hypothetical protein [Actinoplanes couchii]|uniref:Uncharacterized protein n=1 Tax=Actinoplanes couchii TaxID=403638 RepID=A0ABQ3XJD5_9ACTN|nr:hypothetical protein [Actinoplanes couchii]MDR6324390.1 hypothetical protein [Actinoplanes couchii]GID58609.1 hypothetical protein Aco03nite_070130 [Actinoplanes couchii]